MIGNWLAFNAFTACVCVIGTQVAPVNAVVWGLGWVVGAIGTAIVYGRK